MVGATEMFRCIFKSLVPAANGQLHHPAAACRHSAACAVFYDDHLSTQLLLWLLLIVDYKPAQIQPKRVKKMIRRNEALQKVTSESLVRQPWL
jgi:hypothetical protein